MAVAVSNRPSTPVTPGVRHAVGPATLGDVRDMLDDVMSPTRHFVMHVLRCAMWLAALVAAMVVSAVPLQALVQAVVDHGIAAALETDVVTVAGVAAIAVAAALLFFSTFAFFHDAAHGALGLRPLVNDLVLCATSAVLMMSGHGQRQLHLRHHARPLEPDDLEGKGALTSLWMAALVAPTSSFHMRAVSLQAVPAKVRPWVVAENVINVVVTVAVIAAGYLPLQVALVVWWGLQLTMNAWASHVPHRAPQWVLAVASRFAWTGSPVVLSLVYHLEHHAHPRVPCANLRPDLDVASPLLEQTDKSALPWAPLQKGARPRPRVATAAVNVNVNAAG